MVEFGRVELEGDHITLTPTAEQAARAAASTWRGPHRASDTHNPALVESPEVREVHRMSEALSAHLQVRPAGISKYAEARARLGLPAPTAVVEPGPARRGRSNTLGGSGHPNRAIQGRLGIVPRPMDRTPRAERPLGRIAVEPARPMPVTGPHPRAGAR